jgi:hypothetical protein
VESEEESEEEESEEEESEEEESKEEGSEEEESEEEEIEEEESEEESEIDEDEQEQNIFTMPRDQLTPAQRRLKWVKFEYLPLYLQEFLKKKKKPAKAAATTTVVESSDDDSTKAGKVTKPVAAEGGDEDKLTTLNLKNDFTIDYSKYENVHNKLREIHEERNKGRKNAKHHAELLAFMLEQAKDPK